MDGLFTKKVPLYFEFDGLLYGKLKKWILKDQYIHDMRMI